MIKDLRRLATMALVVVVPTTFAGLSATPAHADFLGSPESNYVVLFEGGGGSTLHFTSDSVVNGNVGVGNTGQVGLANGTINGELDFSAADTGQFSSGGGTVTGGVVYSVAAVTTALNDVNSLSANWGAVTGTDVAISGNQTINGSDGTLQTVNGVQARVFNITSFSQSAGQTLTINGDGHPIVFNSSIAANFHAQMVLTGGLTDDQVLWNFWNGASLTGGDTLSGNTNNLVVHGIFLDPNGAVSFNSVTIDGRVFGGDTHDMQLVSNFTINAPTTVPEPATLLLLGSGLVAAGAAARRRIARRRYAAI